MLTEDAHKQEERETEAKKKKFKEAQKLLVQLKKFWRKAVRGLLILVV